MTRLPKRLLAPLLALALMMLSMPAQAAETTTTSSTSTTSTTTTPPPPGPVTTVLPLLGAPLTIEITFDETGALQEVVIDPSTGFTPVANDDPSSPPSDDPSGHEDEVKFLFTDGSVEIKIEAEDGKLETKVEASTIDALTGPGNWTADVFGTGPVLINYTVGSGPDGPTISIDGVSVPDGVDWQIGGLEIDHDGTRAELRVSFVRDGVERTFKIRVGSDGDGEAKLKLTLSDFESNDHDEGTSVENDDESDDHGNDQADNADESDDHGNDQADDDNGDDHGDDKNSDDGDGDGHGGDGDGDGHGDDGDD